MIVIDHQRKKFVIDEKVSFDKIFIVADKSYNDKNNSQRRPYPGGAFYEIEKPPNGKRNGQNGDDIKYKIGHEHIREEILEKSKTAHKNAAEYPELQHPSEVTARKAAVQPGQEAKKKQPERLHRRPERSVAILINDGHDVLTEIGLERNELPLIQEHTKVVDGDENKKYPAQEVEFPHARSLFGRVVRAEVF